MHFIVTLIATFISFIIWYTLGKKYRSFHLEILPIMLGSCSIMWLVDCFAGLFGPERKFLGIEPYVVEDGNFVEATAEQMQEFFFKGMNDLALGITIVAAALIIYGVILLIIDPLKRWKKN